MIGPPVGRLLPLLRAMQFLGQEVEPLFIQPASFNFLLQGYVQQAKYSKLILPQAIVGYIFLDALGRWNRKGEAGRKARIHCYQF